MVLTFAVLTLLSALVWGPAQAAEPVDATEAERAELAHMLRDAGDYIWLLDDEASALPLLTEVARRAQAMGDTDTLAAALTERSNALELLGDPRGAIEALQEAIPLLCASALPAHRTQCARRKLNLGRLMAGLGDAEAIPQLEEAARQAQADGDHGVEIVALNALGEAFWARDALEDAKRSHQRALDLAIRLNAAHEQRVARLTTHGGQEKGPQTIHSERGLTERSVIVRAHGAALVGLGRVAMERGDLIQATAQHEAALGLLGRLRAEWERGVWPSGEPMERLLGDRAVKDADTAIEALALYELGRVWSLQGRLSEAETSLIRAHTLFGETFDESAQADVMLALAALAGDHNNLVQAIDWSRSALVTKTELGEAHGRMSALLSLGVSLARAHEHAEAKQALEEAQRLAVAIGSRSGEAVALRGLAYSQREQGELVNAEITFIRALALLAPLGMPKLRVEALLGVANTRLRLERGADATQSYDEALELAQRLGFVQHEEQARMGLSRALQIYALQLLREGDLSRSEAAWRRSITLSTQTGDETFQGHGWLGLAVTLEAQGKTVAAREPWRRSVALITDPEDPNLPVALIGYGEVLAASGELAEAEALFRQAIERLAALGRPSQQVSALLTFANLLSRQGRSPEVEQTYEAAILLAASLPDPSIETRARLAMARWLVMHERRAEVKALLRPCVHRARSSGRDDLRALCLSAMSLAEESPQAALRLARRAVRLAESAGRPAATCSTLVNLAQVQLRLGDLIEAEATARRAIVAGEASGDLLLHSDALYALFLTLYAQNRTRDAAEALEASSRLRWRANATQIFGGDP